MSVREIEAIALGRGVGLPYEQPFAPKTASRLVCELTVSASTGQSHATPATTGHAYISEVHSRSLSSTEPDADV